MVDRFSRPGWGVGWLGSPWLGKAPLGSVAKATQSKYPQALAGARPGDRTAKPQYSRDRTAVDTWPGETKRLLQRLDQPLGSFLSDPVDPLEVRRVGPSQLAHSVELTGEVA